MALVPLAHRSTSGTDPTTPLKEALVAFEECLTNDQRQSYRNNSIKPEASDVITFITQIDRENQTRASRCVASRLSTFLEATQQFVGVVDTFVSSNPAIGALVWGGVKFAILAASNVTTYFDKVTSMIMAIGKFCPIYEQFGQLFADSKDLQRALCEYYAVVIRLCTQVMKISQRRSVAHFFSPITTSFESDFKQLRDELDQATKVVQLRTSLAAKQADFENARLLAIDRRENQNQRSLNSKFHSESKREYETMRQWRLRHLDRELSKLKSRIRSNLSTVNNLRVWKHIYEQRAPCTAEWILKDLEFISWNSDEYTSVLWCYGTLGMGKTVLVSNILAHLQRTSEPNDIICYHFCRTENQSSLSARTILGSLARQMLDRHIANTKDRSCLDDLEHVTQDLEAKEVVDLLLPLLEDHLIYYLVIDGLDEVEHKDLQTVSQSLAKLCRERPRNLKILYAGRPEIEQCLCIAIDFNHRIAVTKSRVADDVDQFVRTTLHQCLEDGNLRIGDPALIPQLLEILGEVSEDM